MKILEASSSLLLTKGLRKEAIDVILLHADTVRYATQPLVYPEHYLVLYPFWHSKMTDGDNHRSYLLKVSLISTIVYHLSV